MRFTLASMRTALAALACAHGCAATPPPTPPPRVAAPRPVLPAPRPATAFHTGDVLLAGMTHEGDGELSEGQLRATVHRSIRDLRRCYLEALADAPALRGRAIAEFTLGASGRVFDAVRVRTPARGEVLAPCVAAALRTLVFPMPIGGAVRISVLLDFVPFE